MIRIAIDRGGTFTDVYAVYEGKSYVLKLLSESDEYDDPNSEGVKRVLGMIFEKSADEIPFEKIEWIRMGTTVATNALLERKGEEVTLFVTEGFEDILKIGSQRRPHLFAKAVKKSPPLYKEVVSVKERVVVENGEYRVETEVNPSDLVSKSGYKAAAVLFLHSSMLETNEKKAKSILKRAGFEHISLSSEVSSATKAVDRGDTAVVDAYLTPVLERYKSKIAKEFQGETEKLFFIKSDANLATFDEFRAKDSLLSGPAGGVVALKGVFEGRALIGFDMGGTSTDVCRYDGREELIYDYEIAGVKVAVPTVEIHTVAAGGGSRLFAQKGVLRVGPESSGSDPGPVCYKKGGYLSVTDANLITGRLDADSFPKIFGKNSNEPLGVEEAKEAFEKMAKELNTDIYTLAEAFLDVANENMASAIKEITLKKGFDPAEHTLCCFGGAGGQHAVFVARKLGIKSVFIHKDSGVFSAVGIAGADLADSEIVSLEIPLKELKEDRFKKRLNLDGWDIVRVYAFVKYRGAGGGFEIEFDSLEEIEEKFKKIHKRSFGFLLDRDLIVEWIKIKKIKKSASFEREKIVSETKKIKDSSMFIGGRWLECSVYSSLAPGERIVGPALIVSDTSTVVLDEASEAKVNEYGDLTIEVFPKEEKALLKEQKTALMANRLSFVASKMGHMLKRTAVSVNIKEREDFSCAIFDANGDLVSSAPHIPVHLGSMSSVVKSIAERFSDSNICDEVTFITNAPYEGGSHLPDITVVTPFSENGRVRFWVASRGHHADIGGSVPGSMPPFSTALKDEGAVIEAFEILKNGYFNQERIVKILREAGARRIEDNINDIKAQISANMEGLRGVLELYERYGEELYLFFERIKAYSEERVRSFFAAFGERVFKARDYLDCGAEISLEVTVSKKGEAVFDFRGTSKELLTNQNAPESVVRSAVIYAIRVMIQEDIPLNEGILAPVEIVLPKGSLLSPSKEAAVAGGNVTTSQRVVDTIFKAFEFCAASNGCMNNVMFGDESFGYYETIGGGAGACENSHGEDGVHTHMTNTKITDVETLEREYPVRVRTFRLRKGSGGEGKFRGGEGIERSFEFLKDLDLSVLSERRVFSPYGLKGGECGKRGENLLVSGERVVDLCSRAKVRVKRGDIFIIKTPGGGGYGEK